MSEKSSESRIKHLEITMRDVMDSLEDTAIFAHYKLNAGIVEVLSIEPARYRPLPSIEKSKVIPINQAVSSTITENVIQRKIKMSA